ncbi:hypothetical protein [Aurantimonas sp. VKM B-3413]|uniref:hypothetical protein n=1 Tax=Aurantimonas sp. VKM B-3413 TaxID=2779401 RepID=UPI001E4A0ADC|nr:hypothetical protein [Aurantimonas sp. VKM B-3413]MCB8836304.1 hypothetical protein [Aurantimonas sp. VKM B-3413]
MSGLSQERDEGEGTDPEAFEAEEAADDIDFGNWPEVVGLVFVALVTWMIFTVTG